MQNYQRSQKYTQYANLCCAGPYSQREITVYKTNCPSPSSAPSTGNSRVSAFPALRIFPSQEVVPRKLPSLGASCELACRHCELESLTIPAEDIRMSRVSECTLKLCLPLRGRSSPVCAHLLQVQFAICPVAQLYSVHLAAAITRIK